MADITQAEFNSMLQTAISQGLPGGLIHSQWKWEDVETMLDGTLSGPHLHMFPYANNVSFFYSYDRWYWRDQCGMGHISVAAGLPTCPKDQWLLIGTLPEGYRPTQTVNDIAIVFRPDSFVGVEINPSTGTVRIYPHVDILSSNNPYCFISTSFAVSQ